MRVALGLDDFTDTVSVEFECDNATEAEKLLGALVRMVERGHIDLRMADSDGEPPKLSTVQ